MRRLFLSLLTIVFVGGIFQVARGPFASAAPDTAADPVLPRLKVSGNRIVTSGSEHDVVLRGANVLRSEWDLSMSAEQRAIPALDRDWNANVILRGFASDPVLASDSHYLAMLDEHVSLAAKHGMYVIFAWRSHEVNGQQPKFPDDNAQRSLAILAERYKDKTNVMYALQVEPHDVTWTQLHPRFVQMVDAIHRASAPHKPIVMVPGTEWSRDVSGAIKLPVDRENIVYKTHPYSDSADFNAQFASTYRAGKPIFIGEFGDAPSNGMDQADVENLLRLAADLRLGWAAWAFDFQGGPALVTDNWSFNPNGAYGASVKAEMLKTPAIPKNAVPAPAVARPPSAPAPSAPAPSAPGSTVSVNDNSVGDKANQFSYKGAWNYATGSSTKHKGDDHYTDVAGSTATISFTGTAVTLRGALAPWHGVMAVSLDGGPEQMVDTYAASRRDDVVVWQKSQLTSTQHTVRIRATGTANPAAGDSVVAVDRVEITQP